MKDMRATLNRTALKRRRTRIVATVGPACATDERIESLLLAGVDVFRLNFSHGNHADHAGHIERIRRVAEKVGRHTAILADLCGPKIRTGTFVGGAVDLRAGETVTITTRDVEGRGDLIPSQYAALARDVEPGSRILLDDGKLELRVTATDKQTEITALVVQGGRLGNRKGMNLPNVAVSEPALTEKDKVDAVFAAAQGVDWMALSFVRHADDVQALRTLLANHGHADLPVMAKIEKPEAIDNIEAIVEAVDAIMVARGDLGVEMLAEEVPLLQMELVRLCIERNKPVVVATQMLESMIDHARPTRAEVGDVAQAALARADAVMLSAETAAGQHPVEAVATMDRILRLVEGYQWHHGHHGHPVPTGQTALQGAHAHDPSEALSRATSLLSRDLGVHAVVVPTRSGRTARLVSAERPAAPVIALTIDAKLARRLQLCWGVVAAVKPDDAQLRPQEAALLTVQAFGLAAAGEAVLLVWDASPGAGHPVEPTVSILHAR